MDQFSNFNLTALTGNVRVQQPSPAPPPGIVLPTVEVPLSIGAPDQNTEQPTDSMAKIQPIDGFAPSARRQGSLTTVGAGGSFAPAPDTNNFVGISPVG